MITIKDFEEFLDIVNDDTDEYEVKQTEEFGEDHGLTNHSVLVQNVKTGEFYGLWYQSHFDEGADPYDVLNFPMCLKSIQPKVVAAYEWNPSKVIT